MPIKERVLNRLTAIEHDLDQGWKTGEKGTWDTLLRQMEEARNLCREGLPESSYAACSEIYDGMILVGKKMIEEDWMNAQEDIVFQLFELVRSLTEQARKEQHFKKEMVFLPYKASM